MARDFTRQALYDWGWLPAATADRRAAAEDVLLVVSELVTNACLHAEGPDLLTITSDRKVIRLEVTDRGTGQPSPRTPHRAGRPGATACSSSSACAWTGACFGRPTWRARRCGPNSAPRRNAGSPPGTPRFRHPASRTPVPRMLARPCHRPSHAGCVLCRGWARSSPRPFRRLREPPTRLARDIPRRRRPVVMPGHRRHPARPARHPRPPGPRSTAFGPGPATDRRMPGVGCDVAGRAVPRAPSGVSASRPPARPATSRAEGARPTACPSVPS